jgi:hypothetical protein
VTAVERDDDALRETLAAALHERLCKPLTGEEEPCRSCHDDADALLPVVLAYGQRRAAAAIEPFVALADEMEHQIAFRRETNPADPVAEVRETDLRWLRLAISNARDPR